MIELKSILAAQVEAALCMLHHCVERCPPGHWEGKIANDSFRQIAYHTVFLTDYHLSPDEASFEFRELHHRGGDERRPELSVGLAREETLTYLAVCRRKLTDALAAETDASLQGPSGFARLPFSRAELYLYNLRHVQHHTGQLSAYLRRVIADTDSWWVKSG